MVLGCGRPAGSGTPGPAEILRSCYWPWYFLATASPASWPLFERVGDAHLPAIARRCPGHLRSEIAVNSGMSTNWMPTVGRGCTPGLTGCGL